MTSQFEQGGTPHSTRSRRRGVGWTIRITPAGVLLLAVINLAILGGCAYGISRLMQRYNFPAQIISPSPVSTSLADSTSTSSPLTATPTNLPSLTPTIQPSITSTTYFPTHSPQPVSTLSFTQGLLILSLDEGGNDHLFA
ncbi:MAG TPA: hypothetical protein VLD65_11275, partial [Anaerolineales bacterium]|nr:hypothetical protein [Anaerolineales bacterium]